MMKTLKLVLEKVDKDKYWGSRNAFLSLSVDLVKVSNNSLSNILGDSAHPVPRAHDVILPILDNGRVSKRKRVLKRMADGTLPERQIKRLAKSVPLTPLNQNANNNQLNISCDNHMALSHDSHMTLTPLSHGSHVTDTSCNVNVAAFIDSSLITSSGQKNSEIQKINGDVSEHEESQETLIKDDVNEHKEMMVNDEHDQTLEKNDVSEHDETLVENIPKKKDIKKLKEQRTTKFLNEVHVAEKQKVVSLKKKKDLSEKKKKELIEKKKNLSEKKNISLKTVPAVKNKSQVKQKLLEKEKKNAEKEKKNAKPEQEKKKIVKKRKTVPSEESEKKRKRRPKNCQPIIVTPVQRMANVYNDPQAIAKRITESFSDDKVRHVSKIENPMLLDDMHMALKVAHTPIILQDTIEDSLSGNEVQVQENIDNVIETDNNASFVSYENCETTCLQEGFVEDDPSTNVCDPNIFLLSPWPEPCDSPSVHNKAIMDELLDGTKLTCEPDQEGDNSIVCGGRDHDDDTTLGCDPGDSNTHDDTSLGCDPGLSTLNEEDQDGGMYSSPLTNPAAAAFELALEDSGNSLVSENALLPNTDNQSSIPFSSLNNDNVKLNDCVTFSSNEDQCNGDKLPEPVIATNCIKTDDTVKIQKTIVITESTPVQRVSVHSRLGPAKSMVTRNANSVLKLLPIQGTHPRSDFHKRNGHTNFRSSGRASLYANDIDHMYMEDENSSDQELIIDEEFKDILSKSESRLNTSSATASTEGLCIKPLIGTSNGGNVKILDPVVKDSFTFNLKNLGLPTPLTTTNDTQTPLFSMKNDNVPMSLFRSSTVNSSFQLGDAPPKPTTVDNTEQQMTSANTSGRATPISFTIPHSSPSTSPSIRVATPITDFDGNHSDDNDCTNDSIHLGNDDEDRVSLCCEDTFTNENNSIEKKSIPVVNDNTQSTNTAVTKWLANSKPPSSKATPTSTSSTVAPPSTKRGNRRSSRWDVKGNGPRRGGRLSSIPLIPPLPTETYPHPPSLPPIPLISPFSLNNTNLSIGTANTPPCLPAPTTPIFGGFPGTSNNEYQFKSPPPQPLFGGPGSFQQPPPPAPMPPPPLLNGGPLLPSSWLMPNEDKIFTSMFDHPLPSRRNRKVQDLGLIDLKFLSANSNVFTIPTRLICDYVLDHINISLYHKEILCMMKALLEDDYVNAGFFYMELTLENRITFNYRVSRAMLLLCSWQQTTNDLLPKPNAVAYRAINEMCRVSSRMVGDTIHVFDHLNLLHTLANCNKITDLYAEYELTSKRYKVELVPEHFAILLEKANRFGGIKVISILIDAIVVLNKEDMLKFTDQILCRVDVAHFTSVHDKLSAWIIGSREIVKDLSLDRVNVVLSIFTKTSEWFGVIVLVELFPALSSKLSAVHMPKMFDTICKSNCREMKTRLMNIIPKLADEQIRDLSRSDWFAVLECSLTVNQLQAAMWIFIKMNNFKISMDSESTLKLLKMLVDNDSYQPAKNILRIFLSSSIELGQFTRVCEIFQKNGFIDHLYMICTAMIDNKLPAPLHSLKWLLYHHINIEKAYQQLANLIKQASFRKVVLNYTFYEQVLAEIRGWGKDMEALSIVYRCLQRKTTTNEDDVMDYSSGIDCGAATQDTVSVVSCAGSVSVSPLSSTCMYDDDDDDMDIVSSVNNSLEIVIENPVTVHDDADTVLIKRSGAKEQFGSVAILLCDLDETHQYSSNVLLTCVSVLLNDNNNGKCHLRFKQLVESMKTIRKSQFNTHDLWLLQQLGVALICHCESHAMWSDGFNVLHCLHQNDINYLKDLTYPHAVTPPPSICSIAMKAISICLEAKRLQATIVVLEGCKFAVGISPSENVTRAELLLRVAVECASDDDLKDHSIKCLEATITACPKPLHTKLKHTVLLVMKNLIRYNKYVNPLHKLVKQMFSQSINVSYEVCTLLVKHLQKSDPTAIKGLVNTAITAGSYHIQGVEHSSQSLTIPPSLTKIETEMILKDHLSNLPHPLINLTLKVYCVSESLHDVESVIGKLLSPAAVMKKCVLSPTTVLPTRICLDVSLKPKQPSHVVTPKPKQSPNVVTPERPSKKPPSKKQEFKRKLCAEVMKALQQYQKNNRFTNEESYKKLVSLVYQYFQQKEVDSEYILTNLMQADIVQVVTQVMSQVDVYSGQDIDLLDILSH